jgi:5-methylcytosine-specific restriction protein A
MRYTGFPPAVKAMIEARSLGLCEVCAMHPAEVIHHRRPRGMGGSRDPVTNSPANALHICNVDHDLIEGRSVLNHWGNRVHGSRKESFIKGWLVRPHDDPREVAVELAYGFRRLDDRGDMHELPQEA